MSRKVELARMSWKENAAIDRKNSVLLLPVGVTEQHGPAGPQGSDYVLAEHVAVQTANLVDFAYVAPTLAYGYSPTFQTFPGNLGLPFEVFKAHLKAVVERFLEDGWRNIVYVNGHAGNEAACEQIARELLADKGIVMGYLNCWRLAMSLSTDLYEDVKSAYGHGAEPTISVMMALFPDDFNRELLVAGKGRPLPGFTSSSAKSSIFQGHEVGIWVDTKVITANGTSADPKEATVDKGHEALRRVVNYCADFLPVYRDLVLNHLDERGNRKAQG